MNQPGNTTPAPDHEYSIAPDAEYEEYDKHAAAQKKRAQRSVRKMFMIVGTVLLLVGAGGAFYWLVVRDTSPDKGVTDTEDSPLTGQQAAKPNQTSVISTKTKHHAATAFMLEFDYPADWNVIESAGSGQLRVQSPALRLTSAEGQTVNARAVFMIRNKQQPLPEFDQGNAVAAQTSEKIAYTRPSQVQRGETHLSFLRYATATGGLHGVYITGDYGYQKDQAVPKADLAPVDPIISLTFERCATAACADGAGEQVAIAEAQWQEAAFSDPLKTLFRSLVIN